MGLRKLVGRLSDGVASAIETRPLLYLFLFSIIPVNLPFKKKHSLRRDSEHIFLKFVCVGLSLPGFLFDFEVWKLYS